MNPDYGHIGLSDEQADLLEIATKFCREKSPIEKVRQLINTEMGCDPEVWREIAELGWLGIAIPETYGGVGLSLAEVAPVMEQMGRAMMATPYQSTILAAQTLLAAGTSAQKQAILPKIAGGAVATLAVMEGDGAWDLTKIACDASLKSEGYALSGDKYFVCDAAQAEWFIVSAKLDQEPALFIIERASLQDSALKREIIVDETKRAYSLNTDGVIVPENGLMNVDRTQRALKQHYLNASLMSAAESCGGAIAVIEYTVDYLKTRKQFGKLIGAYQALKHPIVDAFVRYEQARSHLYSAANCFNEQGTGEIAIRMAKAEADAVLTFASDRAIQFHGGFGFTYDCDAQLYRRRAAWNAALYGDAAYHKQKLAELLF